MCTDFCLNIDLHFSWENTQECNGWVENLSFSVEYLSCSAYISLCYYFFKHLNNFHNLLFALGKVFDGPMCMHASVCVSACVYVVCMCVSLTEEVLGQRDHSYERKERDKTFQNMLHESFQV